MQRPSGMTALAVLNFVIAGATLLLVLALAATLSQEANLERQARASHMALDTVRNIILFELVASLLDVGLLIPAGIGYLRQSQKMGRLLGNLYGGFGVLYFIIMTAMIVSAGGIFSLQRLSVLVFPGITLVLINIVFRQNFVR